MELELELELKLAELELELNWKNGIDPNPVDNKSSLVQVMDWHWTGKPDSIAKQ